MASLSLRPAHCAATVEYRILFDQLGVLVERLRAMALAGVEACWLPTPKKAALRISAEAELAELDAVLPA